MEYDASDHEILSSERAFDGKVVKVFLQDVRLPDGRTARWEKVAHTGAVGMVPLHEDGTVEMVRQYRNAVGGMLLEIPAGKLDRDDEPPEECAQRELAEEVGYRAGQMMKLAEFYNSPGFSDEYFHLYLARDLEPESAQAEPNEFLEKVQLDIGRAMVMIASGEIIDAKSIIGITLTRLYLAGEVEQFHG